MARGIFEKTDSGEFRYILAPLVTDGSNLEEKIDDLSNWGVNIEYGDDLQGDLVNDLGEQFNGGPRVKLTPVEMHLAGITLDAIYTQPRSEIENELYVLGGIHPEMLLGADTIEQYMELLSCYHNDSEDLADEFIRVTQDRKYLETPPKECSDEYGARAVEALDLLKRITRDFADMGEPISIGRIRFLAPYATTLAAAPQDRRIDFIGKMIEGQYPFNPDNKESWLTEIASAMDIK
jgi:hypothetical protein